MRAGEQAAPACIDLDRGAAGNRRGHRLDEDSMHGELREQISAGRLLHVVGDFHRGGAKAQERERENEMIDRIREVDRHAVARANVDAIEMHRGFADQQSKFAVGERLGALPEGRRIRPLPRIVKDRVGNVLPARVHGDWGPEISGWLFSLAR